MNKLTEHLLIAVVTIALGIMLIVFKNDLISIAMTALGVVLLVWAIADFFHRDIAWGIIKAVIGVGSIVCGWTLMSAALYIISALLIIYALLEIYITIKNRDLFFNKANFILKLVECIIYVIVGLCLLFNQGGTIEWVFILSGVVLIINGAISLFQCILVYVHNRTDKNR